MKNIHIKHILIIRFKEIGDAIVSTVILNTLRKTFPDAQIDIVLNKSIAPLFKGHPSIDRIISFDKKENKNIKYLKKIYLMMHQTHYDAIIDMRSTIKTFPFSIFSLSTPLRIGRWKRYNKWVHNYRIKDNLNDDRITNNLSLLKPLEKIKNIQYVNKYTLHITDKEKASFKDYMINNGININKPIILVEVTSKIDDKIWDKNKMVVIVKRILESYTNTQLIFNYVPGGKEEQRAYWIYNKLNKNKRIFFKIKANSVRELAAMNNYITFFFGNEGGTGHVAHAMNVPSFVICAPTTSKKLWIPRSGVLAKGISSSDFVPLKEQKGMSIKERYDLIPLEEVWKQLKSLLDEIIVPYSI